MMEALYNDYKNNCYEYMKTLSYTERIINDNNTDESKLLNIYEKAIKSAESMFSRMQLEVETNGMTSNKQYELNNINKEINEYKKKLRKYKEDFLERNRIKNDHNNDNYDDRILLLSDVDILEKGDVYINQSKILMNNSEYITNDIMNNLHQQKEYIKKSISNVTFVSDKLNYAKKIMKSLKYNELFNKYRLYIIFLFIFLTFSFIICVKYNRYVNKIKQPSIEQTTEFVSTTTNNNNTDHNHINNYINDIAKLNDLNKNHSDTVLPPPTHNERPKKSIIYDFTEDIDIEQNENSSDKDTNKSSINETNNKTESPLNKNSDENKQHDNNDKTENETKLNSIDG
ncbi:vesicle transport v-SNARE protein VTI1, putative [Hepatocystis sp. ex Piliocolobus tephrosceles]|nr:vesicle transport v-SNARE protein VTI1, putative [Hepatocystis sp. ex Piliocolobus tephrosceles]